MVIFHGSKYVDTTRGGVWLWLPIVQHMPKSHAQCLDCRHGSSFWWIPKSRYVGACLIICTISSYLYHNERCFKWWIWGTKYPPQVCVGVWVWYGTCTMTMIWDSFRLGDLFLVEVMSRKEKNSTAAPKSREEVAMEVTLAQMPHNWSLEESYKTVPPLYKIWEEKGSLHGLVYWDHLVITSLVASSPSLNNPLHKSSLRLLSGGPALFVIIN